MAPEPIQMKDTINGHPRPPWVKYNKEWHNLHAQRRKGIEEACLIEATGTAQNPMCDVCAKIFQHDQTVQCKSITGDGVVKCSRCANRHARCAFKQSTALDTSSTGAGLAEPAVDERRGSGGGSGGDHEIRDNVNDISPVGDEGNAGDRINTRDEGEVGGEAIPAINELGAGELSDELGEIGVRSESDGGNSNDNLSQTLSPTTRRLCRVMEESTQNIVTRDRYGQLHISEDVVKRPTGYLEEYIREYGHHHNHDGDEPPMA